MNLKPQDILFLLKLVARGKKPWSFKVLSVELGMSPSEVHAAAKRSVAARLAVKEGGSIRPNMQNLLEFLEHGIQYVFVPERGELNRGIPTAYASAPLDSYFVKEAEPPSVWPDPDGDVRGESFSPLYKSAPKAARNDPELYHLLALVDAIRGGREKERDIAKKELKKRLIVEEGQMPLPAGNDKEITVIGEEIIVPRNAIEKLVHQYGIKQLVLFGSAARGQLKSDSDIDLLVEFEKGKAPSLGGMIKLKDAFSILFGGREVDIASPAILNNPYRRRAIEKDMEVLYAA